MKRLTVLLLALCTLYIVQGAERYEVKIGDFSALKVTSSINVDYVCQPDSAGMAVFYADAPMASCIGFTHSDDELRVSFTTDEIPDESLPRVTVYSSSLVKVSNTADSAVRVLSDIKCPTFRATQQGNGSIVVRNIVADNVKARLMTGNGKVILYGKANKANYTMIGAGLIQGDGLEAKEVSVKAGGTGQIGCWAVDTLTVKGVGSTTVYYRGTPPTIKKFALGVKIEPLKQ